MSDYGPRFPSFWAAIVAMVAVWSAMILRVGAPGRALGLRRVLLAAGVLALLLTVALYYVVEHH